MQRCKTCRLPASALLVVFALASGILVPTRLLGQTGNRADSATNHAEMRAPGHIQWDPFEPIPGVEWAVLAGDPEKAGVPGALIDYVIRLKFPAGSRMPSHWHPRPEYPMLVSGEFRIGQGTHEHCVPQQVAVVGQLGYAPAEMVHCGYATTETVIQLMGPGPYVMNLVSPGAPAVPPQRRP